MSCKFELGDDFCFRNIQIDDFDKGYIDLMSQLSVIRREKITKIQLSDFVNNLHKNHIIMVIEDIKTCKIVGSITILIENKVIHDMGCVAHVEDVVIDENYRKRSLASYMIEHAMRISILNNCYKIILDCSIENKMFYEKCGFEYKNVIQMNSYLI